MNILYFQVKSKGISGAVTFDEFGFRKLYNMNTYKITQKGLQLISYWENGKTKIFPYLPHNVTTFKSSFQNKTLKVLIALVRYT